MTIFTKSFGLALLCLVLVGAARADQLSDDLNREYQKRVLGVRYAIHSGTQQFDSAGKPLNPGPATAWEIYGGVLIGKLSLKNDQLQIDGMRVAPPAAKDSTAAIPLGRVRFEIQLDRPLESLDDARMVLGRVFYLDDSDSGHRKPELRRTGGTAPNPLTLKDAQHTQGFVAPKPRYTPEPDFSEQARKAQIQGTLQLDVLIDGQGSVAAVRVARGQGYGLEESAMDAVKDWRFTPATMNGTPVSLWLDVEVGFHLYGHR